MQSESISKYNFQNHNGVKNNRVQVNPKTMVESRLVYVLYCTYMIFFSIVSLYIEKNCNTICNETRKKFSFD